MARNTQLAHVLETWISEASRSMGVATPGYVISYDAATRTATVQPGVHRLVPQEEDDDLDSVEPYAPIQSVPVCWLTGRGIRVNATLGPGDSVLLVCLDRDMAAWRRTGVPSEPDDPAVHDYTSCVAIPGLVPDTSPFDEPECSRGASAGFLGTTEHFVVVQNGDAALVRRKLNGQNLHR